MNIEILQLIEGARKAQGLTVVIDVFRAFSVACYVFGNGAKIIIPVNDFDKARDLKLKNPDFILMGERNGKKPDGFDYGNSPARIEQVDFSGKTVIHTTTAGTKGLVNATKADEIITGSFVNAKAVVNYIESRNPLRISLVCMGAAGIEETDEDTLCAQYLRDILENKPADFQKIVSNLKGYETTQKFFNPDIEWAPEKDFALCMSLNRFDFVLKAEPYNGDLLCLRKYK
ncbi:MAG: 2-phosphosulfolactate phosphatase [Candidatus Cloacimonadota bacterium]|nr:MAG: 2-phosphosulfolactate phosphatase [Candidatus Cloacimonadota bacterium]